MNYGFLIRNDRCIGCHACSTACKSENEVPLGVNRTWVKYVETGAYPDATRHFQVTRCNHCANPPCVRICPVTAMYQREDGIVEFDSDSCIGCKACLQACPYDAIYIDPESGTAAKCHYCAHRTDIGLEPACVVVCPEHAIIAGDLGDPLSEISRMIAESQVTVRKPEQGTSPKLFYTQGQEASLTPTATERAPDSFMWSDVIPLGGHTASGQKIQGGDGASTSHAPSLANSSSPSRDGNRSSKTSKSGTPIRQPQKQGLPAAGPIMIGDGTMADHMVQVAYNAQHKIPWHWQVPAYLVTKGIGAGLFLLLALGYIFKLFAFDQNSFVLLGGLSVLFMLITTALLVFDLERPERFLRILTRPQWKSWLVRGAYLLVAFSTLVGVWWIAELAASADVIGQLSNSLRLALSWIGLPLALGAAVYTAFLFGQAEGRDLWQSTLLPVHLIVQTFLAASATVLLVGAFTALPDDLVRVARIILAASIVVDILVTFLGEFGMPHASDSAALAARSITHGKFRGYFWSSLVGGHLIPLALLLTIDSNLIAAVCGLLVIVGLYLYEYAFVMAPQEVPNS